MTTLAKNPNTDTFNKCPYCGGADIQRNHSGSWFSEEKQTLSIEVECENCGKEFEEVYKYIGIESGM